MCGLRFDGRRCLRLHVLSPIDILALSVCMCGALSLRKCVVWYHESIRARKVSRTFLPAYLPRLMMATRPTLRTRRTLSAVVAGRSRQSPSGERDCKELRWTYTSWLLVGTVSMSCRSKSSGQRNLEAELRFGEFRSALGHVQRWCVGAAWSAVKSNLAAKQSGEAGARG
jgi:hypothetical protein